MIYTPSLSCHFIPTVAPPANLAFTVTVCSLQVSPFLPGGVEALLDSAEPEADLAINLWNPYRPYAGSQGGTLSLFYFWSCKWLESRFKVNTAALCAERRKGATKANPELGSL